MIKVQYLPISFYLNDQYVEILVKPEMRAIDLIRENYGLTGTKEVCSEGDCGACTIALGRWEEGKFIYRATTSCILPAAKLHGTHVITAEGLVLKNKLHLIQQMMLNHHAVQCGYCSPGIVMSLFCLFSKNATPSHDEILAALEGNLCRCTGYKAIDEAALATVSYLSKHARQWQDIIFPDYAKNIPDKLKGMKRGHYVCKQLNEVNAVENYLVPTTLGELFECLEKFSGYTKVICGGTDLMVDANVKGEVYPTLIDISEIEELNFITEQPDKVIIGAATTYTRLLESHLIQEKIPALCDVIRLMASTQIRNIASLGGNIATAAPVADGACALLGLGAVLCLKTKEGARHIPLEEFYLDYMKSILGENEIIVAIEIPFQKGFCSFEKGSKRLAVDISKICSFVNFVVEHHKIIDCRIAFGGAQKYLALAKNTMKAIKEKGITDELVHQIPKMVFDEFNAYTETRSEPKYRESLIKNQMIRHLEKYTKTKDKSSLS